MPTQTGETDQTKTEDEEAIGLGHREITPSGFYWDDPIIRRYLNHHSLGTS